MILGKASCADKCGANLANHRGQHSVKHMGYASGLPHMLPRCSCPAPCRLRLGVPIQEQDTAQQDQPAEHTGGGKVLIEQHHRQQR